MAFLKVYSNGEERTVFLGDRKLVFGRGEDADVFLKDVKASRHHCTLEPLGSGAWQLRDLGSANGTKLNGVRIALETLAPDDVIQVGDARILFAGEAAAVAVSSSVDRGAETQGEQAEGARPPRPPRHRKGRTAVWIGAGVVIAIAALALIAQSTRRAPADPHEAAAYRAVASATDDDKLARLATDYLMEFGGSERAAEVRRRGAEARARLADGTSARASGFDPDALVADLPPHEAVARLAALLKETTAERRPLVESALAGCRERLDRERERFFGELEGVFRAHVEAGEFAHAREIWFFLKGEPSWEPIPDQYRDRIVGAMVSLENSASVRRTALFEEVARAEQAHDFPGAMALLAQALPRFKGTAVERSLAERVAFLERAILEGAKGEPTRPRTDVPLLLEKKVAALLEGMRGREFGRIARELRAIADEAKETKAFAEIDARAAEIEACAALHERAVARLMAGDLPSGQILKRWRVLSGDAAGVVVQSKGSDLTYAWTEVPADLYLALLGRAIDSKGAHLGFAVASFVLGGTEALAAAFAVGSSDAELRPLLDRYIAFQVRREPLPEGGYVAVGGEILSRKEHLRRAEEAVIRGYQEQMEKALAAIKGDRIVARVERLAARKEQLDKARDFALELIFDEKKYFYPYRGVGRDAEYARVQQEVDQRVNAVREIWEDRTVISVSGSPELTRSLKLFDEAAAELGKRLVDVEEKSEEVDFLRSYLGRKFDIRTLYRTPEERELLRYGDEVMAWNPTVKGDITEVEREQVRVTNDYRIMFGRWPVRIVEKLVLSSRGHCAEMQKLNYFGHFSPTPGRRTPYDRMKLAGYEYGSSENCIMGQTSPMGAHQGWCHSSGHHRNILTPEWTEMGTGHHGNLMTQNYGMAPRWVGSPGPITPGERPPGGDEEGCGCAGEGGGGEGAPGFNYDDEDGK